MMRADSGGRPAGMLRRLAAICYDALLVLALWMATLLVLVVANGGEPVFGAAVQCVLLLEAFGFFAGFWCRAGQTAGMRAWQLRLVCADGGRLSFKQAAIRFAAALVSVAACGLGYFWALFDERSRTWPDLWSGSEVHFCGRR